MTPAHIVEGEPCYSRMQAMKIFMLMRNNAQQLYHINYAGCERRREIAIIDLLDAGIGPGALGRIHISGDYNGLDEKDYWGFAKRTLKTFSPFEVLYNFIINQNNADETSLEERLNEAKKDAQIEWRFHTAPSLNVYDERKETVTAYVLDPSFNYERPLPVEKWCLGIGGKQDCLVSLAPLGFSPELQLDMLKEGQLRRLVELLRSQGIDEPLDGKTLPQVIPDEDKRDKILCEFGGFALTKMASVKGYSPYNPRYTAEAVQNGDYHQMERDKRENMRFRNLRALGCVTSKHLILQPEIDKAIARQRADLPPEILAECQEIAKQVQSRSVRDQLLRYFSGRLMGV